MKILTLAILLLSGLFLACDETTSTSNDTSGTITVTGTVVPSTAIVQFIMGQDTTSIEVSDGGMFSTTIAPGKGKFIITADKHKTYSTSPTYTLPGTYDLGTITLSDIPSPLSSIVKNNSYTQNNYLFYLNFSEEMTPDSKSAVSTNPDITGSLVWTNNYTRLYFYPIPSYADTTAFTVAISTYASTKSGEALDFTFEDTFQPNEFYLSGSYPSNGTTNFSRTSEAYISFSVHMSDENLNKAITTPLSLTLKTRVVNNYIYISPESGLWPAAENCTLSINDTLYAKSGAPLSIKNYQWVFTTSSASTQQSTIPKPLSSIYKNYGYSQDEYLFYLNFSEEMTSESKNAVSTVPDINGSYTWTDNNTRLYFYPVPSFMDTTKLTVKIDISAVSKENTSLEFPYEESFTANDARITRAYPTTHQSNFSVTSEAYLQFSVSISDSNLPGAITLSPDSKLETRIEGTYLYIMPKTSAWPSGTTCTLSLKDTLYSLSGVPIFVDDYKWDFTTRDQASSSSNLPAPVSSIYQNSSYSSYQYLFYIRFTEEMETSSEAGVTLDPSIDGNFVWTESNTRLYFYPVPSYLDTTAFTLKLDTQMISKENTRLEFPYEITYDASEQRITRSYPDHNSADFSTSREAYIQFSTGMSENNLQNAIQVSPTIPLNVRLANQYIYILPSSGNWDQGTTYTLSLADTVYTLAGLPIYLKNYSWSFTTNTTTSSSGTSGIAITPDSGATDFSLTGNVYVRITNQNMFSISQIKNGFRVLDEEGTLVGGRFNMQSTYFYFYPSGLKMGKWYDIKVFNVDSTGTVLDTIEQSSFRTVPFSPSTIYPTHLATLEKSIDPFRIELNGPVDKLSVISSLGIAPETECEYTVSSDKQTITILPFADAWEAEKTYTLSVNTLALLSADGDPIEKMDTLYSFNAPKVKVIDHSPLHNILQVDTLAPVTLTFNTIMDTVVTNSAFSLKDSSDNAYSGDLSWNTDMTILTFSHNGTNNFEKGMIYTVAVDSTATDSYSVKMKEPFSIQFTVRE
ncbi:MAG: Ig-like domain-containing protein [Fibrobacteria bacterium]|nr:Ig-like domain-containing protein [Fibrobacteria bacterium]